MSNTPHDNTESNPVTDSENSTVLTHEQHEKSINSPPHSSSNAHTNTRSPKTLFRRIGVGVIGLLLLVALGLSIGSAWFTHQKHTATTHQLNDLMAENQTLNQSLSHTNDQLEQLETQINAQVQRATTQQHDTQTQFEKVMTLQLDAVTKKLKTLEKQQRHTITQETPQTIITDALSLVYRKLNFEHDVLGTIRLLERIIEMYCAPPNNEELIAVCLGLETDRTQLRRVPVPSITRIVSELTTVQHRLNKFASTPASFRPPESSVEKSSVENTTTFEPMHSGIRGFFEKITHNLSVFTRERLVRIHQLDSNTLPLTISQRDYLVKTLNLTLEQAKSAAIRQDQTVYNAAIDEVTQAIQTELSQHLETLSNVLSTLSSLRQLSLRPELPQLNAAYAALANTIQTTTTARSPSTNRENGTNHTQTEDADIKLESP
ncbi:MAG: uroporphyrinogen-III C-methyltransferase [Gammaproteobacteria bacterium]